MGPQGRNHLRIALTGGPGGGKTTQRAIFESAAVGDISIEGGNPTRTETNVEARELDKRLRELWSRHPALHFIPHSTSFFAKLHAGLTALQGIVDDNGLLEPSR